MGDIRARRSLLGQVRRGWAAAARSPTRRQPRGPVAASGSVEPSGRHLGFARGARDSHETPEQTAVREAHEEAGLTAERLTVRATVVTAEFAGISGTRWSYTTVIADAGELLDTVPNGESAELRWVGEDEVAQLPLHPGFAASWQKLRTVTEAVQVDHNHGLPRTVEFDGEFFWCMPGDADQAPSERSRRISALLQARR